MADTPYTSRRNYQYRGPSMSEDYNLRIEENYKDLVTLYNKQASLDADLEQASSVFVKDLLSLARGLLSLETRIEVLEEGLNKIGFYSSDQIDVDRFDSTPYAIQSVDRCSFSDQYGILTLPKVETSCVSKVRYSNDDGTYSIPASLEVNVIQDVDTADNTQAVIDSSQPINAMLGRPGKIWDRNVIIQSPNSLGASCWLYIKIPTDLSVIANTNSILLDVFPMKSADIMAIEYTIRENPKLTNSEEWVPLNSQNLHATNTEAIGWIAPGAWNGDSINDAASKQFIFDPKPITAIRIKLRQKHYFKENNQYIYSYGLSKFDVRYDKFLDSGKTIIRLDAPNADTISSIRQITPKIWNIPEYLIPDVFSYRFIWETSYNSGVYTLNPVAFSKRVWMEITLKKTLGGGTPSLNGVILTYI